MGAMISTVISTIALVAVGVLSAMTAINTRKLEDKDRKTAHRIATWTAIISFVVAVLSILIAIFFL